MICWGFAPVGVSLNLARDLGGRFLVLAIWGTKAAGGSYAAISALTNFASTLAAVLFYEIVMTDSARGKQPFVPLLLCNVLIVLQLLSPAASSSSQDTMRIDSLLSPRSQPGANLR